MKGMTVRRYRGKSPLLKFLLLVILALICLPAVSQAQEGGSGAKIGKLTGRVIDAVTKQPVEYATIPGQDKFYRLPHHE
jgi:hypothetical protein